MAEPMTGALPGPDFPRGGADRDVAGAMKVSP
jgi:hypothetical protein